MTAAQRLQRTLNQLFRAQAVEAARRLTIADVEAGRLPDMSGWARVMADASKPVLLEQTQRGMLQAAQRIAAKVGVIPPDATQLLRVQQQRTEGVRTFPHGNAAAFGTKGYKGRTAVGGNSGVNPHLPIIRPLNRTENRLISQRDNVAFKALMKGVMQQDGGRKASTDVQGTSQMRLLRLQVAKAAAPPTLSLDFDLFQPRVLDAVDAAAFKFCRETMDTAATDLRTAVEALRRLLREGLPRGDAVAFLARKVREIFADPMRSFRIAVTETSRAMNSGSLMAAKESGLALKKSWLCSQDACSRCLELGEHEPIPLDQPFYVDPKGGVYASVMAPPLHPH